MYERARPEIGARFTEHGFAATYGSILADNTGDGRAPVAGSNDAYFLRHDIEMEMRIKKIY
jgi:hypothetical protein